MIWVKLFKNEPSKICGRQPLKYLKWYGLEYLDPFGTEMYVRRYE